MFELRFPPPERVDDEHLERVRQVIALARDAQARRGNRAGNQAIIDEIGVDVRLERDEAYCGEALDYHLGLLYAHLGDPNMAAHHFERSGTHPGTGGNQLFSSHQTESLELLRRQELAKERGIPSVLIASMPRSASASLTQTIAALLDAPIMRASCGRFPDFLLVPRWFNSCSSGGAVLHDHFGAIPFNVKLLRDAHVGEVFVRVRDPRPAAASSVNLIDRKAVASGRAEFEDRVLAAYEIAFIPWLTGWLAAAADAETGLKIHWVTHGARATREAARHVLAILAAAHPALADYARAHITEITANLVTGEAEAWRASISERGQERLWEATPQAVRDLLGLQP